MSDDTTIETIISVPAFLSADDDSGISLLSSSSDCKTSCMECEATPMSCGSGESTCNYCMGTSCEGSGQGACSTTCQTNICQSGTDSCQMCEDTCTNCESACQYTCQSCQVGCERYFQGPDIDPWSWDTSNGSADDDTTVLAYEAVTGNGSTYDFSHLVWNDLCDKIAEIQNYDKGSPWATDGPGGLDLDATRMDPDDETDRILTADRFNSMKYNLGRCYSTVSTEYPEGIPVVEKGDPVQGSYFTVIADKINEWLDSL